MVFDPPLKNQSKNTQAIDWTPVWGVQIPKGSAAAVSLVETF